MKGGGGEKGRRWGEGEEEGEKGSRWGEEEEGGRGGGGGEGDYRCQGGIGGG